MKQKTFNIILLFLLYSSVFSQEDVKKSSNVALFHVGWIPYQLCSRSFGAYTGYSYKNFGIEYRPTFTYATGFNYHGLTSDWFVFQGINNNLVFKLLGKKLVHFSLLAVHRYWWYNKQFVYQEKDLNYLQSSKSTGFGAGAELSFNIKSKIKEVLFFINATHTRFTMTRTTYGWQPYGGKTYYYSHPGPNTFDKNRFSMAIGFKIGWNNSK